MKYLLLFICFISLLCNMRAQDSSSIKRPSIDLGKFSISLAVKDIESSLAFYEKLGFKKLDGAGTLEQKWLILVNGSTKLGLFQGMFPMNTLTFSVENARALDAILKSEGVKYVYSSGLDQQEGPCSISFLDPDGNPVLIDQH